MKKTIYRITLLAAVLFGMSSCDFLDIVPDEMATDKDAFADPASALRYVYSCYSYLPAPRHGSASLDFMTGDEVVTAFEHETFAAFPKGNYSSSNPVISYWNSFFQGLRQCYLLLGNLDRVPNLSETIKQDYEAQAKFLIAYYHFLLVRCYGPTILVTGIEDIATSPSDYKARMPLDACVTFVCDLFDEAAAGLPARRSVTEEYGLATSVAAKALKAKMLLYAASPLFNGNAAFYADLKNHDGTLLMPTVFDPEKWAKCRDAMKEAIQLAESAGYALYTNTTFEQKENKYPENPTVRRLRYNIMEAGNPEILFADCRDEGYYGAQNKSIPFSTLGDVAWNGVAPTWNMLNRFYTKNGLPYDEDPAYKDKGKLDVVTVDEAHAGEAEAGGQTLRFNLDREPRFYAWIAFQAGYFEVLSAATNGAYAKDPSYKDGRLVCDFVLGGNCSRRPGGSGNLRTNNYSPTGYLNKKGVLPSFAVSTNLSHHNEYPWPIVRLADLYLGYAEACVETGDLDLAKTYLDKVRERAGIPSVETSWNGVATLNQAKLREIVRNERMNEFYLENQNFWDMRRWLLAGDSPTSGTGYFNQKARGLNIEADNINDFAQIKTVDFERKFSAPMNYLLPLPNKDLNSNENLVNNPGY